MKGGKHLAAASLKGPGGRLAEGEGDRTADSLSASHGMRGGNYMAYMAHITATVTISIAASAFIIAAIASAFSIQSAESILRKGVWVDGGGIGVVT